MNNIFKIFYLIIFIIPLIVNPFGINIYSTSKSCFFLLILGIMFILFIKEGNNLVIQYNKNLFLFLLFSIISLFISSFFSISQIQSIFGFYGDYLGLFFYILIFIHFLICINIFNKESIIHYFFELTKLVFLLVLVFSILQLFNINLFNDLDNKEFLFRVYGTIGHPNFLGQILIFPFWIVIFSLRNNYDTKYTWKFFYNIILIILIVFVLYLTKNRASWIALSCGMVLYYLSLERVLLKDKLKNLSLILIGGVLIIYFYGIDFRSINSRFYLWKGSLEIIGSNNLFFGSGLNSFYQDYLKIMPKEVFEFENFYSIPFNPHNEFIENIIERGLLGGALYLIPIIYLFYLYFRGEKNYIQSITLYGLITYYISVQFSFSKLEHYVFIGAFWAILLNHSIINFRKIYLFKYSILKYLIYPILFSISIFVFFVSYSLTSSDLYLKKAIDYYVDGEIKKASEFVTKSINSTIYYSYPYKVFINLFGSDDDLNNQKYINKYADITGKDYEYYILKIKNETGESSYSILDIYYKIGLSKFPNLPLFHTEITRAYLKRGDCKKANESYKYLISLTPFYFRNNIENCESEDKCRIFLKHASNLSSINEEIMLCIL